MSNSSDEEVYEVEKILKDRTVKGKKQYFIKWLGYPSSENTWEYESNIFCDDLKLEYEEKKSGGKKTKDKKMQPNKFRPIVTNEWDETIKSVTGVSKNELGKLEVEYETYDGKKGVGSSEEIHTKAPLRLLEFYEENLSFPE